MANFGVFSSTFSGRARISLRTAQLYGLLLLHEPRTDDELLPLCANRDYIAGIQHLYRLPLFLIVTFSGGGNQNLSARMRMPAVSGFRLEYHVGDYHIECFTVGHQPLEVCRSVEIAALDGISLGKERG